MQKKDGVEVHTLSICLKIGKIQFLKNKQNL